MNAARQSDYYNHRVSVTPWRAAVQQPRKSLGMPLRSPRPALRSGSDEAENGAAAGGAGGKLSAELRALLKDAPQGDAREVRI